MSNKILLAFLGKRGGGSKYSLEAAKALIHNGYEVYVLISESEENIEDWKKIAFKDLRVIKTYKNVFEFIFRTFLFLFKVHSLKVYYKKLGVNILYTPMIQPWSFILNFYFHNYIRITTLHDPIPHLGSNLIFNKIVDITVRFSDKVIILSESFKKYTSFKYNIPEYNVFVIEHGLFCYKDNSELLSKVVKTNDINFLFFGRITEYKGLSILIKSYNMAYLKCNNISLKIVGEGDLFKYVKRSEILNNNVSVYNNWISEDDVQCFFSIPNTICVVPYIQASQSGVINIAKCSKVLIISTAVGGLKEQVNENNALIIKENDIMSLYEAMINVIERRKDFDFLIDNSLKEVDRLSWNKLFEKFNQIIYTNRI